MTSKTEHKKKTKFCFIILHYGIIKLTAKAVMSILMLPEEDKEIIIVDNGTNSVVSFYAQNKDARIHIIESETNIGFSKGNNLGFYYAKENFDFSFLIVINNDIIFNDKHFLSKLEYLYQEAPFHVAGPDIYTPNEVKHSNPFKYNLLSTVEMNDLLQSTYRTIELLKSKPTFSSIFSYIKRKRNILYIFYGNIKMLFTKNKPWLKRYNNVVLHGSCLIFDRRYCDIFDKLFEPEVFLYCEEYYLAYRCHISQLTMSYFPEIHVLYKHRGSHSMDKLTYQEYCNERINILKHMSSSIKNYIEYTNSQSSQA